MRIGPFKKSKENIQSVDVLIIGGNLTGISTAFNLANKLKIMVVDKSFIGNNLFNKIQTVAVNNFNHKKISNIFSEKYTNMYFNFLLETTDILRDNIIKNDLRCNLLVGNKDEDKNIYFSDNGVYKTKNLTFNLKEYVLGLKKLCLEKNIIIKEYKKVLNITKKKNSYKCKTNKGIIMASKVIVACHDFKNLLPLSLFLRVYKCNDKLFTNDGLPYVGCFKPGNNTLLISYGYNNNVIENSVLASKVLRDLIIEEENPLVPLLSLNRHTNIYNLQFVPINVCKNLKNSFTNKYVLGKSKIRQISLQLKEHKINFSNIVLLLKERVK